MFKNMFKFMYRIWQPMTLRSQTIFFGEQRLFFRTAVATSSRCGTIFLFHVSDECFNVHALLSFSSGHLNFYKSRWSLNAISCTICQNVDLLWDYQLYKKKMYGVGLSRTKNIPNSHDTMRSSGWKMTACYSYS